jgi:eukaryotic-like serine/threonine-protein kinase
MAKAGLELGTVIDGFTIGERVHKGGMAVFYAVTHPDHLTPMLMKVPILSEGEDPATIVGFEMEQMILPKLSGKHVPHFIAAGDFAVHPYLVYERVLGTTLYPLLEKLPLPPEDVAALGAKVATALHDLHRQNVIHLDIKPSNIILREGSGEVVLIDYGLSRHLHLPDLMAEEFKLPYGTAPYMAPEQVYGIRTDPRSDLFALGCMMYFFATGQRPFGNPKTLKGLKRRLWWDPMPPRALNPKVPPWLQEIILRCLAPDPAARHPTAAQLSFDLTHPDQVQLNLRANKLTRDPWGDRIKRKYHPGAYQPMPRHDASTESNIAHAPIVAVAVDLTESHKDLTDALRVTVQRIMTTVPDARLAVLNVRKPNLLAMDTSLDEEGHSIHVQKLVALKDWSRPIGISQERVSYHVLEGMDAGAVLLGYVQSNHVDHVVLGARTDSRLKNILGSVSIEIVQRAPCTVTVVRKPRDYAGNIEHTPGDTKM